MANDIKQTAISFMEFIIAGKIDEAYEQYVHPNGNHHDVNFPAGFAALKQAMKENHEQFPDKKMTVKHVLVDGDMVTFHAHVVLQPDDHGLSIIHILRFESGKIAEMWDCVTPIPADYPNTDGAF